MEGKIWGKAEERKQVERIRALIEETDEGSYIRLTFAGICDMCMRNIDNDFGDSPIADFEAYKKRVEKENMERGQRIITLEHERDTARDYAQSMENKVLTLEKVCESKDAQIAELRRDATGCGEELARVRKIAAEQELTIRELKAKLYDYMVREEN